MNRRTPALLAGVLAISALLPAQENPPPWWGIADNDTVSLGWTFDSAVNPLTPTFQSVPGWFTGAPFTNSPNITRIASLGGNVGVLGFTGAGSGSISLKVDNDPRPDWIKVFWFQYDEYSRQSGTVAAAIREDLGRYQRASMVEFSRQLNADWTRTTVGALLIPQPIDEDVDFTLTETAMQSVAIDNLFVNSKCIKPWHDEDGEPLGKPEGGIALDLLAITGNPDCLGVTATQDPLTGVRRYWVAGRATNPGGTHELYRITPQGTLAGTFPQALSIGQSLDGISDLTTVVDPGGTFVYGLSVPLTPLGPPVLHAFDANTGAQVTPRTIALGALPGGATPTALTYNLHGALGQGTFVLADAQGTAFEINRAGQLVRAFPTGVQGITGAGYDRFTGMYQWFGTAGSQDPRNIQVVGTEFSGWDFRPTGVQFYGDLNVPTPVGSTPGGVAAGFETVRLLDGRLRHVCIQRGARPFLRELNGPFRYGYSLLGRIAMRNGPPWRGNPNFTVGLEGVPRATFATLYLGFSNTSYLGQPLPFRLGAFGLPESVISAALGIQVASVPVVNGSAAWSLQIPPQASWSYAPTFWQWVVFDPTVTGGLSLSQAGKTVLY